MSTYVTAPIHDLLIRIKNAYLVRRTDVNWVVFSNFKVKILELLKTYKFIESFKIREEWKKKFIDVKLNIVKNPVDDIPNVEFYSKPSRSWYVSYKNLHNVAWGKGIGIVSTNQGLMAAHVAKGKKIGGELIAEIY